MLDIAWVLLCAALVMFMQGGFCFLESGFSRAKNSINVALKNLVDFCVAGIAFFLLGFGVMFGSSPSGLIGLDWPLASANVDPWTCTFFLFQFVFCGTATTIVSGAVAERMRFRAYIFVSCLVSGFLYPIFGHWAWGGSGGFGDPGWLASVGFIDFAGSTVVHSLGGWISLAAVLVLGPRLRRFGKESHPLHGHNLALAVMGVMILWFGWFGFNGGSTLAVTPKVPLILLNTNLAAAAGGVAGLFLSSLLRGRVDVSHVLLGVVAGLVGITASCHIVDPWEAILIGSVAACLCILMSEALEKLQVDDVVGAFPTHAVAGIWGTLAVALLGDASAFAPGVTRYEQFSIQLLGVVICAAWAFGVGLLLLRILDRMVPFRVSAKDELAGLNVSEHGATTELLDLLTDMDGQRQSGNFSQRVRVEPHTEVGQVAEQYNAVLSRVEAEIDRRDRVAEALRQAEQRYRRIFEDAVEGIFQTTVDGRYIIANPALARIYGYESPGQLIDSITDIAAQLYVDPTRREEFRQLMDQHGSVSGFESEIRCKDGTVKWISESARAVRDDVGNTRYYEGTVEDISERRRARQMEREIEVAQHASQAKSDFLAHVSHEIRTPLNGIIGMLDLLRQSSLNESQVNYVRVARSSAKLLLSVINDVLDFSKIEAGKLETSPHEFDLVRWAEEIIESFAPLAEKKGIALSYNIPATMPTRWKSDSDRLKQIATNLLGNAIKFTERGSVHLEVNLVEELPNEAVFRFSIRDTGIGIPKDRLARLFQPFTQADASTTRRYGGTGLGLAISRKLAELLGGELDAKSEPDQGSEFYWTSRLGRAEQQSLHIKAIPDHLCGKNALVISSQGTDTDIVGSYLRRWSIECRSASTLDGAMNSLGTERVDVVLVDDALLGPDPARTVARLRGTQSRGTLVVLSIVPLGQVAVSSQRPVDGVAGYVTRPILQSRLFDSVVSALEKRPLPVGNTQPAEPAAPLPPSNPARKGEGEFAGRRLLVAEDNDVNQFVIREILERWGVVVTIAPTGDEAVAHAQKRSCDLILMDCQMPGMDGFQATQLIRQHESRLQLSPVPIVALTASAIKGDRERCLEAGMNDYITKPIDQNRLRDILRRFHATTPVPASTSSDSSKELTFDDALPMIDPLDVDGLVERCGGNVEFAQRILDKFIRRLRGDLSILQEAASQDDLARLGSLAHSLAGSASTACARLLAQAARQLEHVAKDNANALLPSSVEHLRLEMQRIIDCQTEIERGLNERSPVAPAQENQA